MRGGRVYSIIYFSWIRKRGILGIPYAVLKPRVAHVDEAGRRWFRHRRFSVRALMRMPLAVGLSYRLPRF